MASTMYAFMHPEEFAVGCASPGDPEQAGEMSRQQFLDVQQRFGAGAFSPSPRRLAWLVQATTITSEQARQIHDDFDLTLPRAEFDDPPAGGSDGSR